jgi:NADH-quinone oxidoreductase subunit N
VTAFDLLMLLPILLPAGGAVLITTALAVRRRSWFTLAATLVSLASALGALVLVRPSTPYAIGVLLVIDGPAVFYIGLALAAGLVVTLLANGYFSAGQGTGERTDEFYVLLLLATTGAAVLAAACHFASFFLGLEVLTVSLYALVAYQRRSAVSVEAGVKYLILAAVASAFLLFGMALIYAEIGSMAFAAVLRTEGVGRPSPVLLTGVAMILVGLGFKLALAPFHLWTPDVYQGASPPATAFLSTVSKVAVAAVLLRLLATPGAGSGMLGSGSLLGGGIIVLLTGIAVVTMLVGNLLALLQGNVKRILACSSIAHYGYLVVAVLAGLTAGAGRSALGAPQAAAAYYLLAYTVTTLGAWGVLAGLAGRGREVERVADLRGLAYRRPGVALILTAMLLSLAGIPLTGGFVGKFYLVAAGAAAGLWLPVVVLVIASALGLFYYLRILVAVYSRSEEEGARSPDRSDEPHWVSAPLPLAGGIALAGLTLVLVWLGVYPAPFVRLVQTLTAGWGGIG